MAPGVQFKTAQAKFPKLGYSSYYGGPFSGTSMAAPVVSGAAALLKSLYPNWNNIQIMKALLSTADSIDSVNPSYIGKLGSGRINILAASEYNQDDIAVKPTGFSADNVFRYKW